MSTGQHRDIKRRLIDKFRDYAIDSRLPAERALADEMGVAYLTINRAMRELAWEGYVRRIPRKGTVLASYDRVVSIDDVSGTATKAAVVFAYPNYFSYGNWSRLRETEEQALKQGWGVIEFKLNPETSYEQLAGIVRQRDDVRGVLLLPTPSSLGRTEVQLFDSLERPVIFLSGNDYASYGRNIWVVANDWQRAGYMKASALLEQGHRAIAYVRNEPDAPARRMMLKGMRQAFVDNGLSTRSLSLVGDTKVWSSSREAGYRLALPLLTERSVTGIIFDSIAGVEGAVRAARETSTRIPEDVSVVSSGLNNDREEFFAPPLTTVSSDVAEEIRLAMECILSPDTVSTHTRLVSPKLIERESIKRLLL